VLILKWQEKNLIGWQETKIRFSAVEKYPKWPKSCLRRLGTSWPRKRAVWRHKSHRMFVSLVFVKFLSDETYIFLANIDIQWKLLTTEENAKIQLEAISKMCSFWVCLSWIKPKQRQQQSCAKQDGELDCWDWLTFNSTGLTGLKEKFPELNGQYFYVLITRDWRSLDFTFFVKSVIVCTSILPDKLKFTVYLFVT